MPILNSVILLIARQNDAALVLGSPGWFKFLPRHPRINAYLRPGGVMIAVTSPFQAKNHGKREEAARSSLLVRRVLFGGRHVNFYVFERAIISFYHGNQFDQLSSLHVDLLRGSL